MPLHLALAGGGGTAVAAAMPFFSGALSAGPPAEPRLRGLSLAGISIGALLVAGGFSSGRDPIAVLGGLTYLGGLTALLATILLPLRSGLGPRGWIVVAAYVMAVLDVLAGATLATTYLAGVPAVVSAWATLKPAHAWINLLGFLSLIIAGSLIHLLPTVLGTRISSSPSAWLAVGGTALGAPVVALGFGLGAGILAKLGALVAIAGAVGLLIYGLGILRARGHWTTDPDWHLLTTGQLLGAMGWYAVAVLLAGGRVLVVGVAADGWRLTDVAAPLVVGWVVGAILGASTHLLPAVGPGDGAAHAAQRRRLAMWAPVRLIGFQLGTAVLAVGLLAGIDAAAVLGLILVSAAGLADLALLASAMTLARGARIGADAP